MKINVVVITVNEGQRDIRNYIDAYTLKRCCEGVRRKYLIFSQKTSNYRKTF